MIKKIPFVVVCLIIMVFGINVSTSKAIDLASLEKTISKLQNQISELSENFTASLSKPLPEEKSARIESLLSKNPPFCFWPDWLNDISPASSSNDIARLQMFFNMFGPGYETKVTGIWDSNLIETIIKYQETYAQWILNPIGLSKGTGYFGNQTKGFMGKSAPICKIRVIYPRYIDTYFFEYPDGGGRYSLDSNPLEVVFADPYYTESTTYDVWLVDGVDYIGPRWTEENGWPIKEDSENPLYTNRFAWTKLVVDKKPDKTTQTTGGTTLLTFILPADKNTPLTRDLEIEGGLRLGYREAQQYTINVQSSDGNIGQSEPFKIKNMLIETIKNKCGLNAPRDASEIKGNSTKKAICMSEWKRNGIPTEFKKSLVIPPPGFEEEESVFPSQAEGLKIVSPRNGSVLPNGIKVPLIAKLNNKSVFNAKWSAMCDDNNKWYFLIGESWMTPPVERATCIINVSIDGYSATSKVTVAWAPVLPTIPLVAPVPILAPGPVLEEPAPIILRSEQGSFCMPITALTDEQDRFLWNNPVAVATVELFLKNIITGSSVRITGNYDINVYEWIRRFQTEQGLPNYGWWGPQTTEALRWICNIDIVNPGPSTIISLQDALLVEFTPSSLYNGSVELVCPMGAAELINNEAIISPLSLNLPSAIIDILPETGGYCYLRIKEGGSMFGLSSLFGIEP